MRRIHRAQSIARYARKLSEDYCLQQEVDLEDLTSLIQRADNGGYLPHGSLFSSVKDSVVAALGTKLQGTASVGEEEPGQHWRYFFPLCSVEMSGAGDLVTTLEEHGCYIGIVSNGQDYSRQRSADSLSFRSSIRQVLSSERAGAKKPEHAIFAPAVEAASVSIADSWFVRDHPVNDTAGAGAAGMSAIWLRGFHSWPSDTEPPQHNVDSLAEVAPLIMAHFNKHRFTGRAASASQP